MIPARDALLDDDVAVPTVEEWMSVPLVAGFLTAAGAVVAALLNGGG